jgi:hypothetical protein
MTSRFDAPRPYRITDPNREPVRVIDQATFHGGHGPLIDLTLCTMTLMPDGQTGFVAEAVVSSRVRFNLSMAKALMEGLGKQVEQIESGQATEAMQARDGLRAIVN